MLVISALPGQHAGFTNAMLSQSSLGSLPEGVAELLRSCVTLVRTCFDCMT